MTIKEVYEKYRHLNESLSDPILTGGFALNAGENLTTKILYELWQSIKESLKEENAKKI